MNIMQKLVYIALVLISSCSNPTSQLRQEEEVICQSIWENVSNTKNVKFSDRAEFINQCREHALVSKCRNGQISIADSDDILCKEDGGVAVDLKFPDG